MVRRSANRVRFLAPLGPRDQRVAAAACLCALVLLAVWFGSRGGWRGRLIELDRAPKQTARFTVDVNAAEWPELAQLPGIGETLARRIVESRAAEGPFGDVEDLRRVRGIGPRTLDEMRPYLRPLTPSAVARD